MPIKKSESDSFKCQSFECENIVIDEKSICYSCGNLICYSCIKYCTDCGDNLCENCEVGSTPDNKRYCYYCVKD